MKFKVKYWLNSLSQKNFYFMVLTLCGVAAFFVFAGNKQKNRAEIVIQTKIIDSCIKNKKIILNKKNNIDDKMIEGVLVDDNEDYFLAGKENVIFLKTKTKRFEPIFGRKVEIEGNLKSTQAGVYYIKEDEISSIICTGEDLEIPENFDFWMKYIEENINILNKLKDDGILWKVESFVLRDNAKGHVYVNYSNFDSAGENDAIIDRQMLIKLNDFNSRNIEIIFDDQLNEDGKLLSNGDKDIFRQRLDIAEYRLDEENQWVRVR